MRYELKPLATVTDKPEVQMLCELVGSGDVDQDAAQAAVWHYNNGLTWEELAISYSKSLVLSTAAL